MRVAATLLFVLLVSLPASAERFFIGSPVMQDLWVDPVNGNDSRSGSSRANSLLTITEAWNRIPFNLSLTDIGYRIVITGGTVPESAIPNFLEGRRGTSNHPVVIQSADPANPARLAGDLNVYDTRYLFLLDLIIAPEPAGDAFHCELCDTIVIRNCTLDGGGAAQETIKINQSQRIYIEDSTITGAYENAIDFVSVQRASIAGNRIHDAGDWCAYVKGGSAYIRVEENEIYDCGTGGFTAGQGTGFQFMTSPWLHYEAYDVKVVNNVIHDTEGAALGVNGGYNILLAHNTMYRTGSTSHMLELVFGGRSCDGQPNDPGRERCAGFLMAGGWGTTVVDDGDNFVRIPNRNVFVYNNIFYNPAGFVSSQHFTIFGPYSGASQNGANVPVPTRADENVQIRGNVIWNPSGSLGIGEESGCADSNPSCNAALLVAENAINTLEPQLVNAPGGDFRPLANGNLATARIYAIPPFTWIDAPTRPEVLNGNTNNSVDRDRNGALRFGAYPPGAYTTAAAGPARRRASRR